jgi:hypothetical protein
VASKGISLETGTRSIAALQLVGKNYVWIRQDLAKQKRLAIAALFCLLIGSKDL